jgi:hypothetical protein
MHLMYLTDNRSVPSISTVDYGCLHDILVVPSLCINPISVLNFVITMTFLLYSIRNEHLSLTGHYNILLVSHKRLVAASL